MEKRFYSFLMVFFVFGGFCFSAQAVVRDSARSGVGRSSGVGTGDAAERNTGFSKKDLPVLCGRYFDECSRYYNPKRRNFQDANCQNLMPQCFEALGPSATECQDKVYACLDTTCQPRGACSDEGRVKEMAVACLEKAGKYFPYSCSTQGFKSVISQILTEAGSGLASVQQTVIQNQISPELQAQLDAQQAALEEQRALLEEQRQRMEENARVEVESPPVVEEKKEVVPLDEALWIELETCQKHLKDAENLIDDAVQESCSPTVGIIFKDMLNSELDFDLTSAKWAGASPNPNSTTGSFMASSCSKPKRLASFRRNLDQILRSLRQTKECANVINNKAARGKMDTNYVKMMRRKFMSMNEGPVSNSVALLDINKFVKNGASINSDYLPDTSTNIFCDGVCVKQDIVKSATGNAMYNIKLLYEMNKVVLMDIENLLSGAPLDVGVSGKMCQGMLGKDLHSCVSSMASQLNMELVNANNKPSPTLISKIKALYATSMYSITPACADATFDAGGCLRGMKAEAETQSGSGGGLLHKILLGS